MNKIHDIESRNNDVQENRLKNFSAFFRFEKFNDFLCFAENDMVI